MRSNVDAREFDQRFRFEAQVNERQSSGAVTTEWSEIVTCWGRFDALMARERIASAELRQVDAGTLWVRADILSRFGIDTSMRVVWVSNGDKVFDIKSISDNTNRGRKASLYIERGLSEAG